MKKYEQTRSRGGGGGTHLANTGSNTKVKNTYFFVLSFLSRGLKWFLSSILHILFCDLFISWIGTFSIFYLITDLYKKNLCRVYTLHNKRTGYLDPKHLLFRAPTGFPPATSRRSSPSGTATSHSQWEAIKHLIRRSGGGGEIGLNGRTVFCLLVGSFKWYRKINSRFNTSWQNIIFLEKNADYILSIYL